MQKGPELCAAHRASPAVTTELVAADVALPTAADDPAHAHVLLFLHRSKPGHSNTSALCEENRKWPKSIGRLSRVKPTSEQVENGGQSWHVRLYPVPEPCNRSLVCSASAPLRDLFAWGQGENGLSGAGKGNDCKQSDKI